MVSPLLASSSAMTTIATVVRLGDIAYYLRPDVLNVSFESDRSAEPCTILTVADTFPTAEQLQALISGFDDIDDVWTPEFIPTIIVQLTEPDTQLSQHDRDALYSLGARSIHVFHNTASNTRPIPSGPYFLHHGRLYLAYRLYPDTVGAFISSTVPAGEDG